METLSVIIPTLNEESSLPRLLAALQGQTRPPDEIIVADAGSTDHTTALAQAAGARVVPGGRPGPGRNAGAAAATSSLLLFLDADVLPEPDFIERFVGGLTYYRLNAATCLIAPIPDEQTQLDSLLCKATNVYLQAIQQISPHAPGFCILIERKLHNRIGGFDESAIMAEDHEYIQRAARFSEFAVLSQVAIPVSLRRLEKEGLVRLALKYAYCEMHALTGKPVRAMPFVYEFGTFSPSKPEPVSSSRRLMDIAWLRRQLGRFDNPLSRLSASGLRAFEVRGLVQQSAEAFDQQIRKLLPEEMKALDHYFNRRLGLFQQRTQSFWHGFFQRLQDPQTPVESLQLLDSANDSTAEQDLESEETPSQKG